ncbi:MAG: hypothetical protein IJB52_14935 [Clostridia bacterium]|nr:hypothetical protein [Clostridia bacterium]
MKKRVFCLLLSMLLLTGCGGGNAETETTAESAETSASEVPEETETEISDDLPDTDYDGYSYRILCDNEYIRFIHVTESTGEAINDAVFDANANVMERFNVKLEQLIHSSWTEGNEVRTLILSGDDAFDLGTIHDCTAGNLSLEGLFHNLYDVPHLNFEKPWWPAYTTESLTLNGKMYLMSNYMSYYGFWATRTMFFNIDLFNDFGLESPYTMVKEDRWTLDNVISMTKDVYEDTNGDGTRDYGDIYGYAMTVPYCLLENFGFEAYGKSADGKKLVIDVYNDATVGFMDKMCDWLAGDQIGTWYSNTHSGRYNEDSSNTWFANGTVLLTYGAIGHLLTGLIDTDTNYGILPMPKLDENQDHFIGACCEIPGIIPVSVSDLDRTGMIAEAMAAEGYKNIVPAYYGMALRSRYVNDEDSRLMLEILFENRVLSFSYIYGEGSGFQRSVDAVLSQGGNFTSYYESNLAKQQTRVDKINAFFEKN